jgi:hypothetical protein
MVRTTVTTWTPGSGSKQAAASAGRRDSCAHRRIRVSARSGLHTAFAAAAAFAVLTGGSASLAAGSQRQGAAAALHRPSWFSATRARGTERAEDFPAGKIIGSRMTKALFAKVHRAYLHVPAVKLSVIPRKSTLWFPRRFVLILRSGVVVAEEFTRPGRDGTTLVARRFHHTYSRKPGATCWHRLPASNPQTLADVGIPFPYTRVNIKVLPPETTAFGWDVASENRAEFWFLALQRRRPAQLLDQNHLPIKRFITYAIDAKSHRLRSLYIQEPRSGRPQSSWPTATLRVRALATAPRLPAPTPTC